MPRTRPRSGSCSATPSPGLRTARSTTSAGRVTRPTSSRSTSPERTWSSRSADPAPGTSAAAPGHPRLDPVDDLQLAAVVVDHLGDRSVQLPASVLVAQDVVRVGAEVPDPEFGAVAQRVPVRAHLGFGEAD